MATLRWKDLKKDAILAHFAELLRTKDERLADLDSAFDHLLKLWEMRVGFTEKLVLLDTGTFALTLSLLSGIGSHSASKQLPHSFLPLLYCSWACLLLSIVSGGLHNRGIVSATEHLFILNASARNQHRAEDRARRFKRNPGLFEGVVLTPDEGEEGESIDLGVLFSDANKVYQAEMKKTVDAESAKHERARHSLIESVKRYSILGGLSVISTFTALLLLTFVAGQSAWVFLQR